MLDLLSEAPTGIQLLAVKPANAQEFVSQFSSFSFQHAPQQINLNCGCPSPDVIRQGGGAALVKRIQRLQELVNIFRKLSLPVTLKIRLGLNAYEQKNKTYLNLLKGVDADAFIIHARHARQRSSEPADWSIFSACIDTGKHIIPNGDISTADDILFFQKLGIKEVMIGRAAVQNPSVFQLLKGGKLESLRAIEKTYISFAKTYASSPAVEAGVLSSLGKEIHSKKWLM